MTREMTTGSPAKHIIVFCLPLMAGNLFQQFYNMADTIMVGKLVGKTALSAVGSVGSLNFLVIGTVIGLCGGFAVPIAQRFGAHDYGELKKYLSNIVYSAVFIGLLLTLIASIFARQLLELLNTPDDIFEDAYNYIIIIFFGLGATILYNILASVIRSLGDSKTPLYFLIFSSILNIILDFFFMKYLNMGVRGAALATVISQMVSGVLCLIFALKKLPLIRPKKEYSSVSIKHISALMRVGLPMALQFSITAVGSVMLQSCVNELGSDVIAAVTIAGKTQLMIVLPAETIGLTMATYCGQNLGAEKPARIKQGVRDALLIGFAYSIVGMLIARFSGSTIALLFIDKSESAVLALVSQFLDAGSIFYPVLVIIFILRNSLQGMGYSLTAMLGGVFELVARAVAGFGFVRRFGFSAVCYANPAAWAAADLLLIPAYIISIRSKTKKCEIRRHTENETAL